MHAIPVVYYHSIGNHLKSCPWSFLTVPIEVFIAQIEWLKQKGFFFATLSDVYNHMSKIKILPEKSIVLTFDDGFLDNYTTVWALALKYDFRFTVYISPDFVEDRREPRPTLRDVWDGSVPMGKFEWWGYLSWEEMRLMEKSKLVDIQSHCMTHTWYPISNKIIDFHHPDDEYFWLWWNKYPHRKPYWLKEYRPELIPFGTPVFENAKSLVARKCQIHESDYDGIVKFVTDNDGLRFFKNTNWRKILFHQWHQITSDLKIEMESEEYHLSRVYNELSMSKQIIEKQLNKQVEFLAWPGGGDNALLQKLAMEAGYKATTKGVQANLPGVDPSAIQRGSSCFLPFLKPILSKWFLDFQIRRLSKPSSFYARSFECLRAMYQTRKF